MRRCDWLDVLCDPSRCTGESPRVVLVVAHPDDEVAGAGARLAHLHDATIVCVTDGAPRDMWDARTYGFVTRAAYADARRAERASALAIAGVSDMRVEELGVADKEASRALVGLTKALDTVLARIGPDFVLTHPYEGGHPDHDAVAFAVHGAVRAMRERGTEPPPVLEFASYHLRDGEMVTGEFVHDARVPECTIALTDAERALKRRMYDAYFTQRHTLARFGVDVERFRVAPEYDFAAPPPGQGVLYDRFPWGMRSDEWRALARSALHELGWESATCAA
jgi:LmbE family N-acetylglucosaminyl deacetylase